MINKTVYIAVFITRRKPSDRWLNTICLYVTTDHYLLIEKHILLLDEQASKYRALDDWFMTPQGNRVAHAFAAELMPIRDQLSGENLLQLGSCGDNPWLSELKFRNKWIVSPGIVPQKSTLIASLTMLPIERDSIDCIIAPLTLEAFKREKNPIDEIDRVLKPMGYAIFFGINPFSFWGAALHWRHVACFGQGASMLTSSLTIKRTMLLRGYRQCVLTSFYYIPPVSSKFLIHKLAFLNEMGKMIWPFPAGFYCCIVQKYQHISPTLVKETTDEVLALQEKSTLQAISQWLQDI